MIVPQGNQEKASIWEIIATIVAVISLVGNFYQYHDSKNSAENKIVEALSERYETVDKEMSYEQALEEVDREIVRLQNGNSILESKNSDLRQKVDSCEQALATANEDMTKLQNNNSILQSENADLQHEVNKLQSEVDSLRNEIDLSQGGSPSSWNKNSVEVPYVIDMGRREAETILKERGLKVQTYLLEGIDESLARYVFKQSIPKGSFVPIGTLIEIEMSEVKQGTPVNVPKVVGMEQNEATSLLNKLGLEFQVWWTEENNISSEYYYVIDQSISADTSVPAGTKLRLEISPVQP